MPPRNTQHSDSPEENAVEPDVILRLFAVVFAAACGGLMLSSCTKPIDVNVSTAEPVKVELSMDVNVYQHGASAEDRLVQEGQKTYKEVMTSRRDRMAEIQKLKDNRLIGENAEGLVSIRNLPAADYGTYVKKTVEAENDDRNFLIAYEAEKKGDPESEVRRAHWRHAQRKAFPGEWIQVADEENESVFRWVQKAKADED